MRTLALTALLSLTAVGCQTSSGSAAVETFTAAHTATLAISGMTCASCSVTVRMAASRLPGVADVDVNVDAGSATVRFDAAQVTASEIATRVTDAGYPTTVVSDEAT